MAELPPSYAPRAALWPSARPVSVARANGLAYGLLYLPSLLAWVTAPAPVVSYAVAWLGSWWILWASMSGMVKPLPDGVGLRAQIMRPVGFTQVVFAGYTALTSIFFALNQLGIHPEDTFVLTTDAPFEIVAQAQRYYLLGHAAFATGVVWLMDTRRSGEWRVVLNGPITGTLFAITAATFVGGLAFLAIPGLGQIGVRLQTISLVSSVLALALALPERRPGALLLGGLLYSLNLGQALLSGWKEESLVLMLLLGVFAYPYYRLAVLIAMPIALGLFLVAIPTYNEAFRELNWSGGVDAQDAAMLSAAAVAQADQVRLQNNGWGFLTGRLSEIGLFVQYLQTTPAELPFWGTELVEQAAVMVVPRVFWPDKPNVEAVVMERVYANGIADPGSIVSAKPQVLVDGYLSAGAWGVWLAGLLYGLAAAWAARLSERWFGGYLIGSALIYTAIFRILWTGSSFEFLVNAVVWSFAILWVLFLLGRSTGRLVRA